ncbi:MAG: T9SS type A sorting domain-containing protein [Chitinophagales bacterium]|nr:T9SS type A sorting domain-containing protein [Chitinophagales bacterium]
MPYKYFSVLPFSIEYNQSDLNRFPYAYGSNYIFDKIKKTHKNISYGQVVNGGHIIISPTPIAVDMTGGWDQYTTNNSTSILNQRDIVFDELSSFINIQIGTKSQGNHKAVNYAVFPDNTTSLCLEDDLLLIKSPILISDTLCPNSVETAILNDKFPNFTKSVQWDVSSNLKIIGSSNEDVLTFEVGSKNAIDTIFVTIVFNNNDKISTYKTVVVGKNNASYLISSKAFPENAGLVSRDNTYKQCQTATVKAQPSVGYEFAGWKEYNHIVSEDSIYQFSVTKERFLIANFEAKIYEVQLQNSPTNGGVVKGAGSYEYGQTVQISAQVKGGYIFKNWTENGIIVSADSIYSFIVNRDRILIANYDTRKFEVNLTVLPSEGGILLGAGLYEAGQSVSIEAQVADGFSFKNWTEDGKVVSTNKIYNFKISNDRNLVANFVGKEYKIVLNASPTEGGILSGGGKYYYGDTVSVLAKPRVRYSFKNWTSNGVIISTDSAYSFKVTGDKILTANFVTREFNINLLASPKEGGILTGGGMYEVGTSVNVSAQASEGYIFKNWTEEGKVISTNKVMNFKATSDRTLIANFTPQAFNIDISASPIEGGTLSGAGKYNYNESATVTAYASEGFEFKNWTVNGVIVSTDSAYSFKVTGDKTLIANFSPQAFNIDISASPIEGGTLSGAGKYNYNESATVTAYASAGFSFLNWTENGVIVSTDSIYQFTVTENKSLIANFNSIATHLPAEKIQYISIYPNPFIEELIIDSKDFEMKRISIYNVIGEKVIEEDISNLSKHIINTTSLSAGTYIIVIDGEKERHIIEGVKL